MLSPSRQPIALLPQDRELINILGISEAEYRTFVRDCIRHSRLEPGKPVNFLVIPFLIQLAIGIALSIAASLLFRPKPPSRPAEIRQSSQAGQNVVGRTEFAPKAGFDSLQNVVELGSSIPVVYAKRETIDGVTYGGVRVNTNMVWSQMTSLGGSQMLRAVFLISEGTLSEVDPSQFAFGDNVLGSYDLSNANSTSSRVTFYVSRDGGRLVSADRVAGRSAVNDTGNAENNGAGDVFQIQGLNNSWTTDFCYAYKPSTQTTFGVYQLIGNGFGFRVNPQLRPAVVIKTEPAGKTDTRIKCNVDGVADAQRQKYNAEFSSRSGVIAKNGSAASGSVSLAVGDTITYTLSNSSDANTVFTGVQEGPDHQETCRDVAQTVSGRQRTWDDALVIGDLYKFGSALLICESRSPDNEIFSSEIDFDPIAGGQAITVTMRCVQAGSAMLNSITGTSNATETSHIYKAAIGNFAIPRAAQVVELGLRSALGVRINGICNFRDCLSQTEIDGRACNYFNNKTYRPDQSLEVSTYQSGSYSGSEERYSFFRIGYRVAGTDNAYAYLSQCFGTRSLTQQAVYNFIRIQMPSFQRWEFRIEPLTGWEIRQNIATGSLEVLDSRISGYRTVTSGAGDNLITITFSGEPVARSTSTFQMTPTRDRNLGVTLSDDGDYADAWGKLAEDFVYEEIQSSANSPEHELVYVNLLAPNPNTPNYDNIALVGMNMRSSTEFSQLNQLSVYINQGIANGIHTFPEVFQDLLLNDRYGVGSVLSPEQVDTDSFAECAQWTLGRKYFFDGALAQPINLRQWGSQTANYFLLDLVIKNGRFALQPAVYFDRPEPITNLYTAGNIIEDSFEFAYNESDQRTPNRVSIKWRQEKANTDAGNKGLFPVIREVTVREVGTAADAPLESIDLSDFCTSERHAIDVAKYICRGRRLITHSVRFKTVPTQAALEVGRCFKLGLETVAYNQPNNGVIDSNGVVTSTVELADGTYEVLLWNGVNNEIQEVELVIQGGVAQGRSSAVFCIKQSVTEVRAYKVQSLGYDEDGNISVEALFFPLQANGYSALIDGWEVDSNWTIEGRIGTSEDSGSTTSEFTGVSIVGPGTVTTDVASSFTALISGGAGTYSYLWTGSGVTFGSSTSATTTVTATSAGNKTITCQVTKNATTLSASKTITSVDAAAAVTIGTVTLNGNTSTTVGAPTAYDIDISGNAAGLFYSWNVLPGRATTASGTSGATTITVASATGLAIGQLVAKHDGINSPIPAGTTVTNVSGTTITLSNALTAALSAGTLVRFTVVAQADNTSTISASGSSDTDITFDNAGTYTVTCLVSALGAADSPKTQTKVVAVT
jgi:hypothetical protein